MTGAPSQGAHELDPLATRYGAPPPLVLVSPPSDADATPATPAWAEPPAVVAASATPDGAAAPPRLLERLGQNCHAPKSRQRERRPSLPWWQALALNLAAAGRAARRAWLDGLDRAWAPRAHRRALELGRRGVERAGEGHTPERQHSGCACAACAGQALVEPAALLPVPEWTLPDPVDGEVWVVPRSACADLDAPLPPRTVRRSRPGAPPELVARPDAPASPPVRGAWYSRRAQALARPIRERVEGCGQGTPLVVACGCGRTKVPTACGQRQACRRCMGRTFRRLRARLAKAMRARVEANGRAYRARGGVPARGGRRLPVMLTLTVRHSGELLVDRSIIQRGWQRLRGWLHRRVRKFDYALTWETTPGTDGLGHVHAHVVALLPFVPFAELRDEWVRATGGASTGIHCAAPKDKDGNRLRGDRAAARAAEYLAKYASKGVDLEQFTPELAANVLDAAWGRRVCSTSHGFWLPKPRCECKACHQAWTVVEKPPKGERQRAVWAPELMVVLEYEDWQGHVEREERWYLPFRHEGGAIVR